MKHLYSPERPLRIGGRGSRLSLAMASYAQDVITAAYPDLAAPGAIEYVVIKTSGDATQAKGDVPLAHFGSKELWTKEIEQALAAGRIDIGLHCVKDVPSFIDDEFAIDTVLEREDPRDCWVGTGGSTLSTIVTEGIIGTSSVRRQGIILATRPDLRVQPLRGNVDTRLEKLRAGQADAIILAQAGLNRLGIKIDDMTPLSVDDMLPACGQGALCFETLSANADLRDFLKPINHLDSYFAIEAERALLQIVDGTCTTPVSAYAVCEGDELYLRALVVRPDGTGMTRVERRGHKSSAVQLGIDLGQELRANGPADIFEKDPAYTARAGSN